MTEIFLYLTVRSGTILHIGHLDFYPSGGSVQPGCVFGIDAMPGGVCSHRRAIYYYFHSIRSIEMKQMKSIQLFNSQRALALPIYVL